MHYDVHNHVSAEGLARMLSACSAYYWHGLAISKDVSVQSRKDFHQSTVSLQQYDQAGMVFWAELLVGRVHFTCKCRSAQTEHTFVLTGV